MSDFWSRRREGVAAEAQAEEAVLEAEVAAQQEAELAERSDDELLAEAELPAPEELDSAEAVREFMSSALPQRLKTRALRQLWKLNPVLANLDGLVDYGEDFTDSATVIENMQTAYQVGKGMLSHIQALAEKAEAEALEDASEEAPETDEPETIEDTEADAAEDLLAEDAEAEAEDPAPILAGTGYAEPEPELIPARRRMQFEFETHS